MLCDQIMKEHKHKTISVFPKMEDSPLPPFCRREIGLTRPHLYFPSEVFIKRLNLYRELTPQYTHQTNWYSNIQFNQSGDHIFSSYGQSYIDFRNWETNTIEAHHHSGLNTVTDFKILPNTNDRQLVLSGLCGMVRHGIVADDGNLVTRPIDSHLSTATNLAVHRSNANLFFSVGRDGEVIQHDLRVGESTTLFVSSQLATIPPNLRLVTFQQRFYPLVAVNPTQEQYFCVGGFDESVRLYDVRMLPLHDRMIFHDLRMCVGIYTPPFTPPLIGSYDLIRDKCVRSLKYSNKGELLVSYSGGGGAQLICLFQSNPALGVQFMANAFPPPPPVVTRDVSYAQHRSALTTRGVSFFGPDEQYVICGSNCGFMYFYKKRGGHLVHRLPGDRRHVTVVQPFPEHHRIATFGNDGFIRVWSPISDENALPLPDNKETYGDWLERAEALDKYKELEDNSDGEARRPGKRVRSVLEDDEIDEARRLGDRARVHVLVADEDDVEDDEADEDDLEDDEDDEADSEDDSDN